MSSCSSLKCSDICKCIWLESANGSLVISKNICDWNLEVNPDLISDITATWDDETRELCILDKLVVKTCVTIPDSDDQSLFLDGTDLSIKKTDGTIVNTVSLAGLIPVETPFTLTSSSLVVTPGGTNGHAPDIELVPSSDVNNTLILGTDGRPYVPAPTAQKDVDIDDLDCITFTKVVTSTDITFTPAIDYQCLADEICDLCDDCLPPAIFITDIEATSFRLYVTNLAVGDTYEVSIDGGSTFIITGQNTSPITVAGLTDGTSYNVVIKHNCATGGSAVTNVQVIITPTLFICQPVSGITITYGAYDFNTGTYPVTITWGAVTGALSYIVSDSITGVIGTVTSPTITFSVLPSTPFSGTIQTICGAGGNSSPVPYSGTTPAQVVCPAPTGLIAVIS